MAILDLQGVPWRVEYADGAPTRYPVDDYNAWAAELGVSNTETLVNFNGDDLAIAFNFDFPTFAGSVANGFISTEGGLGFYQDVPNDTTSTAYTLTAQGISRMYGLGTRPNLLLSFHSQNNLKLQNGKLQKRYGVTIIYAELCLYNSTTVRTWVALRIERGKIWVNSRTYSYTTPWILTELNPATGNVVQSVLVYNQTGSTYRTLTFDLSNNVGLLLADSQLSPALVGSVATSGILQDVSDQPFAGLGSVPTVGVLRGPGLAYPSVLGTVLWPVLANHAGSWEDRPVAVAHLAAPWSEIVAGRQSHQAPWKMWLTATHGSVWSIPLVPPRHVAAWGDLTVVRASRVHPWDDSASPRRSLVSSWEDTATPQKQHTALWEDVATVTTEHVAFWEDGVAPRRSFHAVWSDRARASKDHVLGWGDGELPSAAHQASWGDISAPRRSLASPWADTSSATAVHTLVWADAYELRVSLASPWADRSQATWDLQSPWQDAVPVVPAPLVASWADLTKPRADLVSGWADGASGLTSHQAEWGDKPDIRVTHAAVYADREAARKAHASAWSERLGVTAAHGGSWYLTATSRQGHNAGWSIAVRPVARSSLHGRWALLENLSLVAISNVPEVIWQGQALALHGARLSLDEDSPVWIAEDIEVADLTAWGAIQLGDTIQFRVLEETWTLRVDGKGMNRPKVGELRLSLSAVSPLAWLDAPYAAAITLDNSEGPVSARATVAALLASVGVVRWELDDWLIPAGALAMSDTTPLEAAREIVAAIGGVLESDPDGTPVARWRHPVSVPDYAVATPDHVIQDADLFAFEVSAAPLAGFNRLVVSNEDLSGTDVTDRMEYLDEDTDPYEGEMRAWPNPWRPVTLGHTGHPDTEIEALGARAHRQTELVEFVAGRGQVKYPVQAITSLTWQHADLGSVVAQGSDLIAATAGQSLAWVTYTSLSLDWRVALARDEAVQFVLI